VRVQPRAREDEIAGERDGRLLIRVTASPVDGRANAAVRKLLARALGVAPGSVRIVRGETSRDKLIEVAGLDAAALRRALERAV
jgi:uncharacterized protein (TIGR00251 family)